MLVTKIYKLCWSSPRKKTKTKPKQNLSGTYYLLDCARGYDIIVYLNPHSNLGREVLSAHFTNEEAVWFKNMVNLPLVFKFISGSTHMWITCAFQTMLKHSSRIVWCLERDRDRDSGIWLYLVKFLLVIFFFFLHCRPVTQYISLLILIHHAQNKWGHCNIFPSSFQVVFEVISLWSTSVTPGRKCLDAT